MLGTAWTLGWILWVDIKNTQLHGKHNIFDYMIAIILLIQYAVLLHSCLLKLHSNPGHTFCSFCLKQCKMVHFQSVVYSVPNRLKSRHTMVRREIHRFDTKTYWRRKHDHQGVVTYYAINHKTEHPKSVWKTKILWCSAAWGQDLCVLFNWC